MGEEHPAGKGVIEQPPRERRETVVAWIVIITLVAAMFVRVIIAMWTVGERPQTWRYRDAPMIPAETYSSTRPSAPSATAPRQVELPPPTVGEKAKSKRSAR